MELLLHIYLPKVVRDYTSIAAMHPAASHAPCNAPYLNSCMPCRSDLSRWLYKAPPKTKAAQNCTAGALASALSPAGSLPRAVAAAGALKETIAADYSTCTVAVRLSRCLGCSPVQNINYGTSLRYLLYSSTQNRTGLLPCNLRVPTSTGTPSLVQGPNRRHGQINFIPVKRCSFASIHNLNA